MWLRPLEFHLETDFSYPFDFSLYSTEEIASLVEIVNQFEKLKEDPVKHKQAILNYYHSYRTLLSNQAEEKRCDGIFKKALGFSVFELVKKAKNS